MKKRILCLFLTVAMLISFVPVIANAASSGKCGPYLTWTLSNEGVLTISGKGEMKFEIKTGDASIDYAKYEYIPWSGIPYAPGIGGTDEKVKKVIIGDNVTSIANGAFLGCLNLAEITISNSVKSIGEDAFSKCANLKSIELPNSVTSIGRYAFYECKSLKSIKLSNKLTRIEHGTFNSCGLVNVEIPDGVTVIGKHSFSGSDVESITIPLSVKEIEMCAFGSPQSDEEFAKYCKLRNIYYDGTKAQWNSISVDNSRPDVTNGDSFVNGNANVFSRVKIHYKTNPTAANAPENSFYTLVDADNTTFNVPVNVNSTSEVSGIVQIKVLDENGEQKGEGKQDFSNISNDDIVYVNVPCGLKVGDIIRVYKNIK